MPEFPTCESQGKGLLSIRDVSGTTLYYSACIDIGTAAAPSIVRLPLLPPGEYLAELTVPRTQQQRDEGDADGGTLTDEFTIYPLPLFVTPVSGSFSETKSVFKYSYGYLSSQIIGGYTREGDTAAYPAWNHTLLNRAVFWKPNELHNIDVRYPQLLYALPQTSGMGNSTGRLTIESYSQGWKQRIYIDDAAYEQNRIRKNVPNADILRWTGVFNLPLGEYLISVQMYNTNDQRSFHSRTGVFLREE
jgi:hypothetical protein